MLPLETNAWCKTPHTPPTGPTGSLWTSSQGAFSSPLCLRSRMCDGNGWDILSASSVGVALLADHDAHEPWWSCNCGHRPSPRFVPPWLDGTRTSTVAGCGRRVVIVISRTAFTTSLGPGIAEEARVSGYSTSQNHRSPSVRYGRVAYERV